MEDRLKILVESRIHREMYVRFGGEHRETYHSNMIRRLVFSLRIYIPGAITRDVAKQSADRSMQAIGLTTVDPSWGAQAASAGIEAAKTLFSKKIKLVKVTVKAGYQVLLYDEKQKSAN